MDSLRVILGRGLKLKLEIYLIQWLLLIWLNSFWISQEKIKSIFCQYCHKLHGVRNQLSCTGSLQKSCKFLRHFFYFPQCFALFLTLQYGRFFILVLLGHGIEKKVGKSHPQKKLRVVSNWLNFFWLNFGFGSCQLCIHLSQAFLHHFSKFLCTYCCRFLENWAQ